MQRTRTRRKFTRKRRKGRAAQITRPIAQRNVRRTRMDNRSVPNLIRRPPVQQVRSRPPPPITKSRPFTSTPFMTAITPEVGCVELKGTTFLGTWNWKPTVPLRYPSDPAGSGVPLNGAVVFTMANPNGTSGLSYGDTVMPVNPSMNTYMPAVIRNQAAQYRQFRWKGMRLRFTTRVPTTTAGLATVCYQRDPTAFDLDSFGAYDLPQPWGDGLIKNGQNVWSFPLYDNFTWNVPVSGKLMYTRNYWLNLQYVLSWDDATVRNTFDGMCYFKLDTPLTDPTVIFDVQLDYDLCLYDPAAPTQTPQEPEAASVLSLERQLAHAGKVKPQELKLFKETKEELKEAATLAEKTVVGLSAMELGDARTIDAISAHLESLERLVVLARTKLKVSEAPEDDENDNHVQ